MAIDNLRWRCSRLLASKCPRVSDRNTSIMPDGSSLTAKGLPMSKRVAPKASKDQQITLLEAASIHRK